MRWMQARRRLAIFPGSTSAHLARAGALTAMNRPQEAEKELLTAIALSPSEYTWSDLANLYRREERPSDAIAAMRKAIDLQAAPQATLIQLGYYALAAGHPDDALQAFDEAERDAPSNEKKSTGKDSFAYKVATGRAEAWNKIGDSKRGSAISGAGSSG